MGIPPSQSPRDKLAALVEQHRRELRERLGAKQPLQRLARPPLPPRVPSAIYKSLPQQLLSARIRRSPALAAFAVALTVALFGACLLGGLGLAAEGFSLQGSLSDPSTTAQDFYAALHEDEYTQAYALLSPAAQARLSVAAFTAEYSALDGVAGVVESYTVDGATTSGNSATVTTHVVRRNDPTRAQTQQLTLVQANGAWRIDAISIGATGPAPGQ